MTFAFYTLGCKVNQYETQSLREEFIKQGFLPVSEDEDFDALVINSCTVTAESDRKTRQILHRLRRENPNAAIVLTGCMVQAFSEEAKELTAADVVVGNTDVLKTVELTEEFFASVVRHAGITLHIKQLDGTNSHHIIEGAFKSVARSLRAAASVDAACADEIPSTKGVL